MYIELSPDSIDDFIEESIRVNGMKVSFYNRDGIKLSRDSFGIDIYKCDFLPKNEVRLYDNNNKLIKIFQLEMEKIEWLKSH